MTTQNQRPQSADLHPGPGFRVRREFTRLDVDLTRRFLDYDVPTISDYLNRLYAVDSRIHLLTASHHRLCGPACTVRVYPGDNLMVHKSLDIAKPGDVVVVDAHGSKGTSVNAALGDIISTKAKHREIAGFIVDGSIRDLPGIVELDLPVFARGTTAMGPLHRGPGEVNYPIACGGVVINPGDVMVADASGIVAIPQEVAEALLQRLDAHRDAAARYLDAVRRGEFSNAWVDALLREQDCPVDPPGDAAGDGRPAPDPGKAGA
jgi:regulator of RNase E activity RraA